MSKGRQPSGCLCSSLSMLLYAWRDPKLRRSRTSKASQLLMSPARWSSSIIERYVVTAVLHTLSSHVRRARKFQSAVHCPASSPAAPTGRHCCETRPHHCAAADSGGCQHAQRYSPPRGWRSLQPNGLADPLRFPLQRSRATCPFR